MIEDIYKRLAHYLSWNEADARAAMHMELNLEAQSFRVIQETKRKILEKLQGGNTVGYISDMYLPS